MVPFKFAQKLGQSGFLVSSYLGCITMGKGNGGGQSQRRTPRYYVDEPAELKFGGQGFACRIVDITADGAGLRFDPVPTNAPRAGVLVSARFGQFRCNIKYTASARVGVEFILSDQARDKLRQQLSDMELH